MSFFKNKHVVIALIVAPILAVCSYYLVDMAVKEQPSEAIAGQAYELIAKSNCRFSSGECTLENGNFNSTLTVTNANGAQTLALNSNKSLQQVSVGFVSKEGVESGPFELTTSDSNRTQWSTNFTVPADAGTTLRVALSANDAHYFSETTMGFSDYKTTFNQDFRKQK